MPAPGMMRASLALLAVTLIAACTTSAEERMRDAEERAAAHAVVARTEVVRTLASPHEPGRIIYEKPIDLSYANLKKTRPDLDSAALVHGAPAATEKQRSETGNR
ncbi:MAG TPA: hypothetical protein VFR95_08420 [Gemmatimonadaceae bacterium]|nr:hypothetical protein [Gemmatimonadaceae bacterium]